MRHGVRLAIDYGKVRIGIAKSDASGILASPLRVETFTDEEAAVAAIVALAQELACLEIYVGLPVALSGEEGHAASAVRAFVSKLSASAHCPIRLLDERLTTAAARKQLQDAGYNTRSDRHLIDAAAAVILLEDALESERKNGVVAGELVQ